MSHYYNQIEMDFEGENDSLQYNQIDRLTLAA